MFESTMFDIVDDEILVTDDEKGQQGQIVKGVDFDVGVSSASTVWIVIGVFIFILLLIIVILYECKQILIVIVKEKCCDKKGYQTLEEEECELAGGQTQRMDKIGSEEDDDDHGADVAPRMVPMKRTKRESWSASDDAAIEENDDCDDELIVYEETDLSDVSECDIENGEDIIGLI